jgi:hypothetical protein
VPWRDMQLCTAADSPGVLGAQKGRDMRLNPTKLVLGVLAPLITALSAWLAASVAKYGVHVDPSGVNAALVSGATCGIAVMVKLIHDVEEDPKVRAVSADADTVASAVEQADPQIRQAVKHAIEDEISSLTQRIDQAPARANGGETVTVSPEAVLALHAEEAAQLPPVREAPVERPELSSPAEPRSSVEEPSLAESQVPVEQQGPAEWPELSSPAEPQSQAEQAPAPEQQSLPEQQSPPASQRPTTNARIPPLG